MSGLNHCQRCFDQVLWSWSSSLAHVQCFPRRNTVSIPVTQVTQFHEKSTLFFVRGPTHTLFCTYASVRWYWEQDKRPTSTDVFCIRGALWWNKWSSILLWSVLMCSFLKKKIHIFCFREFSRWTMWLVYLAVGAGPPRVQLCVDTGQTRALSVNMSMPEPNV